VSAEEAAAAVAAAVASTPLGTRCEVLPGAKRGAVRFVGAIPSLPPGPWVGVEYDEPVGKNDGTPPAAKGSDASSATPPARLFECAPGFGGFVRPGALVVGDFPPVEVDFGSEDEI
jgi:tubulin-folding cofactor B